MPTTDLEPARPPRADMTAYCAAVALMAALAFIVVIALPIGRARAADLVVRYDQSQLLRLPRPVAHVIIGNASIADVTVQAGNLLIVTGKTFGVTNIIALDAQKNIIQDQRVVVQRDDERTVNLTKGAARQSYSCTPNCETQIVVGDDPAFNESVTKQAATKTKFSEASSSPTGAAGDNQ
jgi:Flp pilus assembly secretin CpaC